MRAGERDRYLEDSLRGAIETIDSWLLPHEREMPAYSAVLDYPLRGGKGLRPALALAMGQAMGARSSEVMPTAAALELLHNAFLVHDDVEDGSKDRRGLPTLVESLGPSFAIHTGDTMLAMTLEPLLANTHRLDLGRALRILNVVARTMRRTVEGQALELSWIRDNRWDVGERDYIEMVELKTAHYSFVAPLLAGAIIANADEASLTRIERFGLDLGVAFQIRDDVLNLQGSTAIGKERWGDLWEGKRTLILSAFFARAAAPDRERARALLARPRPGSTPRDITQREQTMFEELDRSGASAEDIRRLRVLWSRSESAGCKQEEEIDWLRRSIEPDLASASRTASHFATSASETFRELAKALPPTVHLAFLESIVEFVILRDT